MISRILCCATSGPSFSKKMSYSLEQWNFGIIIGRALGVTAVCVPEYCTRDDHEGMPCSHASVAVPRQVSAGAAAAGRAAGGGCAGCHQKFKTDHLMEILIAPWRSFHSSILFHQTTV
jgi:hypothetical protein